MSQGRRLVVGTRGSRLAVSQTDAVVAALRRAHPELEIAVEIIRTTADRFPDEHLDRLPGVGVFVAELETALLEGRIDAAVHSMKDLPAEETGGLRVAAVLEREDPRDALVTRDGGGLAGLGPGARVGTASPRRAAFLRAARPDLEILPIRGNVETRLRKLDAGEVDALCLALAGLRRIGQQSRAGEVLDGGVMLPAVGQGAVGVQVREGDDTGALVGALDHAPTRAALEAERAVLRRLQGGCRLPLGALAVLDGGGLTIEAAVVAPDGSRSLRGRRVGAPDRAAALGRDLAEDLLRRGAAALLPAAGAAR